MNLKQGQRVYFIGAVECHYGTVSHIDRRGDFTVVFDTPDRRRGEPRTKSTFPASAAERFYPEGVEKARALKPDTEGIDIPNALLAQYNVS